MLGLRKDNRRLLHVVGGKAHATDADHEVSLPTPPATNSTRSSASNTLLIEAEEDILRDPESSGDDEPAPPTSAAAQRKGHTGFAYPRTVAPEGERPRSARFHKPFAASSGSTRDKRSSGSDHASSDSDAAIFSSQSPRKRHKTTTPTKNLHASRPKQAIYGGPRKQNTLKSTKRSGFQTSRKQETKPESPEGPKFQKAKGADIFEFGKNHDAPTFKTARKPGDQSDNMEVDADGFYSLSPSLSSLSSPPSSPEVEELRDLDLPVPMPYVSMIECAICGGEVELFRKQGFEDQFTHGRQMNYRQQERFCVWHKKHEAQQLSEEMGYPEIDWDALEIRMRRHHSHLKDVLSGGCSSIYRDQLSEKVKGRSKTAIQSIHSESGKRGASVGYYGPRGEKVMTDHVITHLSKELREQATKDKLVAASGVSGGVSGFVQAVLVPELAEQLVKEDMKVAVDRARDIIAESVELGELLNPDVDEKVTHVVEVRE